MAREREARTPSPAYPLRFNYRRLVGGVRLLLTEASPWKLCFQRRISDLKADLVATVGDWDGVEPGPHRYGGTEFLLDGREVGHVHEFGLVDVPFARPIGDAVVAAGLASRHHVLPDSGWATTFLEDEEDADRVCRLLDLSCCWHVAKYEPPGVDLDRAAVEQRVSDLGFPGDVEETFLRTLADRT